MGDANIDAETLLRRTAVFLSNPLIVYLCVSMFCSSSGPLCCTRLHVGPADYLLSLRDVRHAHDTLTNNKPLKLTFDLQAKHLEPPASEADQIQVCVPSPRGHIVSPISIWQHCQRCERMLPGMTSRYSSSELSWQHSFSPGMVASQPLPIPWAIFQQQLELHQNVLSSFSSSKRPLGVSDWWKSGDGLSQEVAPIDRCPWLVSSFASSPCSCSHTCRASSGVVSSSEDDGETQPVHVNQCLGAMLAYSQDSMRNGEVIVDSFTVHYSTHSFWCKLAQSCWKAIPFVSPKLFKNNKFWMDPLVDLGGRVVEGHFVEDPGGGSIK